MARIYGFLAGVTTGAAAVYATAETFRRDRALVVHELRHAQDLALDRPKLIRPYTDPIDLETRSVRDSVADIWNAEILKVVQWIRSVGPAN